MRVKKIWSSELSAYNKTIAHNSFATPVITPTISILDWTIQEIKDIDIKIRKVLSVARNFHPTSDIDRLYIGQNLGGRGLRSCQHLFESRIIALKQHLHRNKDQDQIMNYVYNKLLQKSDLTSDNEEQPKTTSKRFTKADTKFHYEKYTSKIMHGYFNRIIEKDRKIDYTKSK